jgi:hypothetical protein
MQRGLLLLALLTGCTRHNSNNAGAACTPGEQRACACIGGATGVQICNLAGTALGECLGCPGGPPLDMAVNVDFAVPPDLAGGGIDFPPGTDTDMAGFGTDLAGADLSVPSDDMAVSLPDMTLLPDLTGADFAPIPSCPIVMLVLDTSGSMTTNFLNTNTSHILGAQGSLDKLVNNYGTHMRFGFTHFDTSAACNSGIVISPEPGGSSINVKNAINATVAGGSTNTGDAIDVIAADPRMHDLTRESFIVLVTDGAGNCEATDPSFTVTQIDNTAKASQPIKTYVIALDVANMAFGDETQMENMAAAGQRPCTSGFCSDHAYYPAPDPSHLDKALDLVLNEIVSTLPGCGGFSCFPSGDACAAGSSCCGTVGCKNLENDAENCGQCGTACGGGSCSGSVCHCGGATCPSGDKCCNGTCCSMLDMSPPNTDMLPPCICGGLCTDGCVANGCCAENGCPATPFQCNCVPGLFGGC